MSRHRHIARHAAPRSTPSGTVWWCATRCAARCQLGLTRFSFGPSLCSQVRLGGGRSAQWCSLQREAKAGVLGVRCSAPRGCGESRGEQAKTACAAKTDCQSRKAVPPERVRGGWGEATAAQASGLDVLDRGEQDAKADPVGTVTTRSNGRASALSNSRAPNAEQKNASSPSSTKKQGPNTCAPPACTTRW